MTLKTVSSIVLALVDDLPSEHVDLAAGKLETESGCDWAHLSNIMKMVAPQVDAQARIRKFINAWRALPAPPTPREMALCLRSTKYAIEQERSKQKVDLVWTGPVPPNINLRRNDQALLELIRGAKTQIIIVSFVVYKVKNILAALDEAALRGVKVTIILESAEEDDSQSARNNIKALGPSLRDHTRIFIWPNAKRPSVEGGGKVSLHVKCAVADGMRMFLSSANLTSRAMNDNMEMGILLEEKGLAARAQRVFEGLIADGTLSEISRDG